VTEDLKRALIEAGVFEELKEAFVAGRERHIAIDEQIHALTIDDITSLVEDAGFEITSVAPIYADKLVLVVGSKRPRKL
jgi:hypothetical protein